MGVAMSSLDSQLSLNPHRVHHRNTPPLHGSMFIPAIWAQAVLAQSFLGPSPDASTQSVETGRGFAQSCQSMCVQWQGLLVRSLFCLAISIQGIAENDRRDNNNNNIVDDIWNTWLIWGCFFQHRPLAGGTLLIKWGPTFY